MRVTEFAFDTKAEAEAFAQGVEFVNDSAVTVEKIVVDTNGKHVVFVSDEDYYDS